MPQGHLFAAIFEDLREDVKLDQYAGRSKTKLSELERHFKTEPLPSTREELETRSALLQLIRELKIYLELSKKKRKKEGQQPFLLGMF